MKQRKLGVFVLILFATLISVGVVSAQESTEAVPQAQTQEQPQPPDGQPVPPDGLPQPPNGVEPPRLPANGVQPPRYPQWQYVQQTTTTTTVYPSQVLLLRHIEQTIADAIGLTRSDVNTLRLSMTFDEVVAMYGGDANAVRIQAIADLQTWVIEGMSDGTITQVRGQLILNNLYEIVDRAFTGALNVSGATVTGLLDS